MAKLRPELALLRLIVERLLSLLTLSLPLFPLRVSTFRLLLYLFSLITLWFPLYLLRRGALELRKISSLARLKVAVRGPFILIDLLMIFLVLVRRSLGIIILDLMLTRRILDGDLYALRLKPGSYRYFATAPTGNPLIMVPKSLPTLPNWVSLRLPLVRFRVRIYPPTKNLQKVRSRANRRGKRVFDNFPVLLGDLVVSYVVPMH